MDKRASLLQGEYRRKAKKVDTSFCNVSKLSGSCAATFELIWRACEFSDWCRGEGSEGLHNLIKDIADSRLKFIGLARGRPVMESWRSYWDR